GGRQPRAPRRRPRPELWLPVRVRPRGSGGGGEGGRGQGAASVNSVTRRSVEGLRGAGGGGGVTPASTGFGSPRRRARRVGRRRGCRPESTRRTHGPRAA